MRYRSTKGVLSGTAYGLLQLLPSHIYLTSVRFPITNGGAAGLVVRTGSAHIINNEDECQKLNKNLNDITGCSTHNVLSVPLTACGK